MSDGGKGDKRRPGDNEAFASNFDMIFGDKRPERGSFVFDPIQNKLVPKNEYIDRSDVNAPMVIGDIQPYQSMVTGEMVTSRSVHRQHLKQHGLIEVGNETKYISKQKQQEIPKGLKETIARQVYTKLK
jgi:hypothetical protein